MANSPLLLVDGSSYLYRAFHALPPLTTSKGQPTGAVRGVIAMLRKLIADYPESVVAVVFDAKGKTFRDEIYPEYKANRPPMPDDLRAQIEPLHQIIRAMGLPLIVIEGVEADDVIGTLALQADQKGEKCIISTGDKDMAQLVNGNVTLVNTMTETLMDIPGVEKKFGIPPHYIIDYLALMGDKVDNIPGVPGVGEKTALGLIQGLGGLEDIYSNLEKIKELDFRGAKTMAKKMEEHKDKAYLSYELATIKTDVEINSQDKLLEQQPQDYEELLKLFTDLEFKSWIAEIKANALVEEAEKIPKEYITIFDREVFNTWLNKLSTCQAFAFDTETTSLNYMDAKIVGVSFAIEPGKAAYVPCGHDYVGAPEQLPLEDVLNGLKPILENSEIKKIGQNLKYDVEVLLNYGVQLQGIGYDTMLESYTLNAIGSRHDMDSLAENYLGIKTTHFEDVAGKGVKQLTFNQVDVEQAGDYAAEDADITLRLHNTLWPQLQEEGGPKSIFEHIEMPLLPVLVNIERNGAMIDAKALAEQSADHAAAMLKLEQQAYELAGEEFNLGSPKQLAEVLYNKLKLPVLKKTAKKAPSTAEEVLQELSLDYPLPKVIMDYRGLSKLKNTYTDKLPQMINPRTGRVHTSYHQAVTATGRLSSADPNLQNIPIRTAEGRRIRQAFIAPSGYKILAADYSQIELRIMAHLSGDKGLTEAFNQGVDVHKATAAEVFATELEKVSTEQRRSAKAINFGLIYGMSAFGLAKQLRIGRNDAQGYINTYFERYPGVKAYMDTIRETAKEKGYVETLFGRRLYLPEINASNGMRRAAAQRTAINAPMQGTAADIIKRAMLSVHKWLFASQIDARIIMQVHDELVLEVSQSELDSVKTKVCELMASAADMHVPLIVDAGVGDNWDEAH